MKVSEESIRESVKPHILRCRDGDWNHAKRVVKWVKQLGDGRGDIHLLVAAAYIHDIGWRDVLPSQKISFDTLLEYEPTANDNSEPYIREVLGALEYPEDDIIVILKLVRAADAHAATDDADAIIVDADSLSKLNIDHVREKYIRDEWLEMYSYWCARLPGRMKTEKGRGLYKPLLLQLKRDIENYEEK